MMQPYSQSLRLSISVRLWQHIEELEADKRALTESLCRAQGKPYISHEKREFKESDGWFDGAVTVKLPEA